MKDLTPREAQVLAVVAYFDGKGGAWPSLQTVADRAAIMRSRAAAVIASLETKGRLKREHGKTTNRYRIAYSEPHSFTVPKTETLADDFDCPEKREFTVPNSETRTGITPGDSRERDSPQCSSPDLCIGLNTGAIERCRVCGMGDEVFPF